jgi:hypothetical protein
MADSGATAAPAPSQNGAWSTVRASVLSALGFTIHFFANFSFLTIFSGRLTANGSIKQEEWTRQDKDELRPPQPLRLPVPDLLCGLAGQVCMSANLPECAPHTQLLRTVLER